MLDDTKSTLGAPEESKAWEALESSCLVLLEGNQRGLSRWFQGAQALSDEISSSAKARVLLAVEGWSALAACRSAEDVMNCQWRFATKTLERGVEDLKSLSQLTLTPASIEPKK